MYFAFINSSCWDIVCKALTSFAALACPPADLSSSDRLRMWRISSFIIWIRSLKKIDPCYVSTNYTTDVIDRPLISLKSYILQFLLFSLKPCHLFPMNLSSSFSFAPYYQILLIVCLFSHPRSRPLLFHSRQNPYLLWIPS